MGLYEATDARYRDWELIEVLEVQIAHHGVDSAALDAAVAESRSAVARGDQPAALTVLERMRPLLEALPAAVSADLVEILNGLTEAVRNEVH